MILVYATERSRLNININLILLCFWRSTSPCSADLRAGPVERVPNRAVGGRLLQCISWCHKRHQSVDEREHQGLDQATLQPGSPHPDDGSCSCRCRLPCRLGPEVRERYDRQTVLPRERRQPESVPFMNSGPAEVGEPAHCAGGDDRQVHRRRASLRGQVSALVVMPSGSLSAFLSSL